MGKTPFVVGIFSERCASEDPENEVATRKKGRRKRRSFTVEDKLRILSVAAGATRGALEGLLRQEDIRSGSYYDWKARFERHGADGLVARKRGPRTKEDVDRRLIELEHENASLRAQLENAHEFIEQQIDEVLRITLENIEDSGSERGGGPRRS